MHYIDHTLPNGLRILMVPAYAFQSISMGVFVKVGARYEPANLSGISHFIEHMLFKGTKNRPSARQIAEAIEGIGGDSNAYTGPETTVYYTKVAAAHVNVAIDFLADLLRNSLFTTEDIKKERRVIGEEINMVFDSPDEWLDVIIDEVLWPDHPLGQSVTGTAASLRNINRTSLISFFKASYHPGNIVVALGGAFDPDRVIPEIDARLGDWPAQAPPAYEPAPAPVPEVRYRIEHRAIEQGHLCLALPGLPRTHPDRYALSILNTLLGDGMSSRLFLSIREEKGLAYAVDSGLNLLQDTGSLTIYAGVDPRRAGEALQAILVELKRLGDDPVPAKELRKAKEYVKGRMVLGLEDTYSQAAWVAYQALYQNEIKSPEEVLAAYEAVTGDAISALVEQLIAPGHYSLAAIGPFGRGESLIRLITE
ncbi:MAG: insulinase family protein [Anaerolineae bacterium]|nr:insulinase family protein [Anaerolineae bacterium]